MISHCNSFSACDTTSSVFQKGKLSFWDAWIGSENDELTQTFIQLSNLPLCVTDSHIKTLEIYLMEVYFGQRCNCVYINDARFN